MYIDPFLKAFSLKRAVIWAAVCIAVLLSGCQAPAETVWETVDDEILPVSAAAELPYIITFGIPEDTHQTMRSNSNYHVYLHEEGDYEICSDVICASSLDDALRQVSGFDTTELEIIQTTRFGLPEYQFAWSSGSDEGMYVSRASLIEDEDYYYALVFSVREGLRTEYDGCAEAVFASLGLHGDEQF